MKHTVTLILSSLISFNSYANQELENAYWDCDYITTHQAVSLEEGATCGLIYEKLLQEKFKGSFKDFMTWWKANKETQHKLKKQNASKTL